MLTMHKLTETSMESLLRNIIIMCLLALALTLCILACSDDDDVVVPDAAGDVAVVDAPAGEAPVVDAPPTPDEAVVDPDAEPVVDVEPVE